MTEFSLVAELNEYPGGAMDCNVKLLKKLGDDTVMIDGVKYQKVVEEPKPITLKRIIWQCMESYNKTVQLPVIERVLDRVEVEWFPKKYHSYSFYNRGWNDCVDELKGKLGNKE